MQPELKDFTEAEHATWRALFERQTAKRDQQIVPQFSEGLRLLGIGSERIPRLSDVNQVLFSQSEFSVMPVAGLENAESFFRMLAFRIFPVGNFIRDAKDLSYTPAPDVFHDLYGHVPFLADRRYADFCQDFGRRAMNYAGNPEIIAQFERLFWFTIEFGLVRTRNSLRVFGAGIASSHAECEYALSGKPKLRPFDLEAIRRQEYRIDQIQPKLFVLENFEQLYGCLTPFEQCFWEIYNMQAVLRPERVEGMEQLEGRERISSGRVRA